MTATSIRPPEAGAGNPARQSRSGPGTGRIGWIVVASMVTGLVAAVLLVAAPFIPAEESAITGAVLGGFPLGWAIMAVVSVRMTDQPQRWAAVPALVMGLSSLLLVGVGSAVGDEVHWVWPCLCLRPCGARLERACHHTPGRSGIAADLHTLLQRGNVPGPYVLAGHSFGGLYTLRFAARYPDDVAGMVLVDTTAPASGAARRGAPSPAEAGSYDLAGRVSALAATSARLGLGRLYGRLDFGGLPPRSRHEGAQASRPRTSCAARSTSTSRRRPPCSRLHLSGTSPTSRWSS